MVCMCRVCQRRWRVSALARIPERGYLCPVCERNQRNVFIRDGWRIYEGVQG